jgi:hypothetical protein
MHEGEAVKCEHVWVLCEQVHTNITEIQQELEEVRV